MNIFASDFDKEKFVSDIESIQVKEEIKDSKDILENFKPS